MSYKKHIKSILGSNRHVSFELFPPRTNQGLRQIYKSIAQLQKLGPDFFSVTYGAGGSTAERSLDVASAITNLASQTCVAHFTCVGMDRPQVLALLGQLEFHGINNVLALRGDPPQGAEQFVRPENGFAYASELVAFIRENAPHLGILVAGYPEGHMENPDKENDFRRLVDKVKAGADGIVTQAFFENRYLFEFAQKLDQAEVTVPLLAGIFLFSNARQVTRIFELSGGKMPAKLEAGIKKWGEDADAMQKFGTEFAIEQVDDLVSQGFGHFHFYTMNRSDQAREVLQALEHHFPRLRFD